MRLRPPVIELGEGCDIFTSTMGGVSGGEIGVGISIGIEGSILSSDARRHVRNRNPSAKEKN